MRLIDILHEVSGGKEVYRGVNPAYGDVGLGINSTKIGDKLVATLGPNHTDNIDIAKRFGKRQKDFIGMDMARKFLEMGFTRARRYANHKSGQKYDSSGSILPQEKDALTSVKAMSAMVFKNIRDRVANDSEYVGMRKEWRSQE